MGIGYLALLAILQARSAREDEEDGGEDFPMLLIADIARRTVRRKKSYLYTRSGDKGTSQVWSAALRRVLSALLCGW